MACRTSTTFSAPAQQVKRDVTPAFILSELIALLRQEKIVRPGYNTLQAVISEALAAERRRLSEIVEKALDRDAQAALQQLLVREETLSVLAEVKQDAKNFGYRMMALEREKRSALAPLHRAAKEALPKLDISQQNVGYYSSLATYYSIYDLRRLKLEQTHLYLLCYSWQRYRQLSDNLADAFDFHMKQVEDATKEEAEQHFTKALTAGHREAPRVGQVLLLYVDETLNDVTPFGSVRSQAFTILSKGDPVDGRPTHVRQVRQPDRSALAGGGQTGDAIQKASAAAGHGARLLQSRHSQPMARRSALDEERLCAATTARATATPRNPREYHPRALAPVPFGIRPGRYPDRPARRPLRVLDLSSGTQAPGNRRTVPRRQHSPPPL